MNWLGIIFSLGGITSFVVLLFHALYVLERPEVIFIFGGGFIAAFQLEYTLVHIFNAYSYQNIPLVVLEIPIVIPMGWVITFYGLHTLVIDFLELSGQDNNSHIIIFLTGIIAVIYGTGIEVLARLSEFWVFYFESLEIFGVPIVVTLAWGLSVAVFTTGLELFRDNKDMGIVLIGGVMLLNSLIAIVLLQLV